MVKMIKDGKEYDIAEARVEKLLKRGFEVVTDTPAPSEDVNEEDQIANNGDEL
jgi:hypothetical protein